MYLLVLHRTFLYMNFKHGDMVPATRTLYTERQGGNEPERLLLTP